MLIVPKCIILLHKHSPVEPELPKGKFLVLFCCINVDIYIYIFGEETVILTKRKRDTSSGWPETNPKVQTNRNIQRQINMGNIPREPIAGCPLAHIMSNNISTPGSPPKGKSIKKTASSLNRKMNPAIDQ